MKKILVTGANGFIGQTLCSRLHEDGRSLRAIVRDVGRSTVLPNGVENMVVGNIEPKTTWGTALAGVDAIVHLAARVHVMSDAATDPLSAYRLVNREGTLKLAQQASGAGVRRFIYLSSIKVNGEQTLSGKPFTEQDMPVPLDPYAISKYEAEEGLLRIAQQTRMEVVIIRPPLVYGPGVKGNFLEMMRWLQKDIPLPLGAIHNHRSLLALDNLVDLIVKCLDHPAAVNQIFIAGDGEDLSTTELLRLLGMSMNKRTRLLPVPVWLLDTCATLVGKRHISIRLFGSLQVDISKSRTMLGWNPPVTVDEALHKTTQAYLQGLMR